MKKLTALLTSGIISTLLFTSVASADSVVVKSPVNFRTAPTTSSKVIDWARQGEKLTLVSQPSKYWVKVTRQGKTGYISSSFVTIVKDTTPTTPTPDPEPSKPATSAEDKINDIIITGKSFMGVPYVWGGNYDKDGTMGFDCSGFINYIFAKHGVKVQRQSSAFVKDGIAVSKANLKRGDLILSDTNRDGKINHVSMYLGGDKILHTYRVGIGVTISNFSGSSWDKTFKAARRIIQ